MDIEIFKLLRSQTIEVFGFLLVVREFATGKGLQNDVEYLNRYIEQSRRMIALANDQLIELERTGSISRIGFFETIYGL